MCVSVYEGTDWDINSIKPATHRHGTKRQEKKVINAIWKKSKALLGKGNMAV